MKRVASILQVGVGLALLTAFALGLVAVFRAGIPGAPGVTQLLQGYPPPEEGTSLPYPPPQGVTPLPPTYLLTPQTPPASTSAPLSEQAQTALRYVSEHYGIPIESLLIVNEYTHTYPLTGRTFRAFTVLDGRIEQTAEYLVLIDPATGEIVEDRAAVETAEAAAQATAEAAYRAKYGKLHPDLYERLQAVADDIVFPVAIVVTTQGMRTTAELYAALAAQFPEAAEAMARGTKPMDVADPELSERIQEAYRQMRVEDIATRLQPLVDWLRERGFSFESYAERESPSLTARLPKQTILEIEARDDVALISLVEEPGPAETPTAILPCGAETSNQLLFETVERADDPDDYSKFWQSQEPGLLIIARSGDIQEAGRFVTNEALLTLSQMDFATYFAIIAFRGWQPSVHEGFQIECVVPQGNDIALYAQAGRPVNLGAVKSPYHLIKVRKDSAWDNVFTFKLYFGEDEPEVASVSHRIP